MLNKQSINVNFAQGLDTKTDPWQVDSGHFLGLQNTIFDKGGLLQKRNGYQTLTPLPNTSYEYLTTFNNNLTAIGTNLAAYVQGSQTWINTGAIQPMDLSVNPIVRSATNQTQADSVVSDTNLVCTVFNDFNGSTNVPKYVITDYTTNQIVVPATIIVPGSAGTILDVARVFLLGNWFMIVFGATISAVNHIQYIAVSTVNPTNVIAATDIAATYLPTSPSYTNGIQTTPVSFDGYVANNSLYVAWNANDGGNAVRMTRIDKTLLQHGIVVVATGHLATYISVTADTTGNTPIIWVSYFHGTLTHGGYAVAVDQNMNSILANTGIISTPVTNIVGLTSVAKKGILSFFYEIPGVYSYDHTIPLDNVYMNTLTQGGTLNPTPTLVGNGVGLASKAFLIGSVPYFLSAYGSIFQPTYFLLNGLTGNVVAKLAYENGSSNLAVSSGQKVGGYTPTALPSALVQLDGITVNIAYLYKDLIAAVNKTQGVANAAGIYSQTGVNLSAMSFNNNAVVTGEIGSNLNITGGITWSYDGAMPVEQNFNLWPDYVEATASTSGGGLAAQQYFYQVTYEWTDAQGNIFRSAPSIPATATVAAGTPITFTSIFSSGVTSITASSATGLYVGQILTDSTTGANITAGTYITSISGTTVGLSLPTAGASAGGGDTLSTSDVGSMVVNIPTLKLTYKTNVKIVIYRWSVAQQNYYQVTSVLVPTLNIPTNASLQYTDTLGDSAILGNNLIYTTGGVIEDIGPPPSSTMTLFDDRLWLVDAQDRNLLWFSKQVIEGTPVEMSDLLTFYVAPTIGVQGSTGPITALGVMDDKLIIFKKDAIYYINGTGPDNTGANSSYNGPIFITSTVGCDNQNSIVFQPQGLMFQSDKGIWLLGRDLSTQYIGAPVQQFNSGLIQSSASIPETNQVRFTLSTGQTLMYDYFYGQWGTFVGVPAISACIYDELHTFINSYGDVYQENPGTYIDGSNPVLIAFTTSWLKLANLQGYQRAYFFYILGEYLSPHKLQVNISYDYNSAPSQSVLITPDNFSPTYGSGLSQSPFGQGNPYGGRNVENWRIFFKQQRCQAFQLNIQEVFDGSFGTVAGGGLTISGLNLVAGFKKSFRPMPARTSIG